MMTFIDTHARKKENNVFIIPNSCKYRPLGINIFIIFHFYIFKYLKLQNAKITKI